MKDCEREPREDENEADEDRTDVSKSTVKRKKENKESGRQAKKGNERAEVVRRADKI